MRALVLSGLLLLALAGPAVATETGDEVWAQYHAAFSLLARGDGAGARRTLAELRARHPEHPAAARAARLIDAMDEHEQAPPRPAPPPSADRPSGAARAELALFQTLHGVAAAIELCVLLSCESAELGVTLAILGAAAGLGGSLLVRPEAVTPGLRASVNSGTAWGAWNGAAIAAIADADGEGFAGSLLLGQAAGLAGGVLLFEALHPTDGQVALGNTAGIWTGALMLMANQAFALELDDRQLFGALLAASDGGAIAGGLLAARWPHIGRGRTLLFDAGGLVGFWGGLGITVLIAGDPDQQTMFAAGMAGTVVGLGAAVWLTRELDLRSAARVTVLPTRGGATVALAGSF